MTSTEFRRLEDQGVMGEAGGEVKRKKYQGSAVNTDCSHRI